MTEKEQGPDEVVAPETPDTDETVVNPAHPVEEDPEQLAGDVVPDPWSNEGSWATKEEAA